MTKENSQSFVIMLRPASKYGQPDTDEIVGKHFNYLQELHKKGIVMMAGRFSEVLHGLVIIRADSIDEARNIMMNDPAIKAEVFFGELYPWRIALQ
ncbi:MAG: YciI family protein [Candidatus Thorarchaeota archaeon]